MKYACTGCGAVGVRLWRQYQTVLEAIRLLCRPCAELDQGTTVDERGLAIGWLVPACPSKPVGDDHALPEDATFWGYSSVPLDVAVWWHKRPEGISDAAGVTADITGIVMRMRDMGPSAMIKALEAHVEALHAIWREKGRVDRLAALMQSDRLHAAAPGCLEPYCLAGVDAEGRWCPYHGDPPSRAYDKVVLHINGCQQCAGGVGNLCAMGEQLIDAWNRS